MSVVDFPKPERRIWVCNCGCSSWELLDGGTLACALCGNETEQRAGGWISADAPLWTGDEPVRNISGNSSEEFARKLITRRTLEPDVVAVVVVREPTTHVWTKVETVEQREWLDKRLRAVKETIEIGSRK